MKGLWNFLSGRRLKNFGRQRSTSLDEKEDEASCPEWRTCGLMRRPSRCGMSLERPRSWANQAQVRPGQVTDHWRREHDILKSLVGIIFYKIDNLFHNLVYEFKFHSVIQRVKSVLILLQNQASSWGQVHNAIKTLRKVLKASSYICRISAYVFVLVVQKFLF